LERSVLYYPNNKDYGAMPDGVQLVDIPTPDGLLLRAWYSPPIGDSYTLVYFHGNGGNLSSLGGVVKEFQNAGLGVLAIDYRGFGDSEGDPSEEGLYLDGLAAFDKAESLPHGKGLVVFGRSLGGGVATYVAEHRQAKGLILESTFTSAKEVARFSHGQKGANAIEAFDSLARIKNVSEPVFFIHGTQDETIPSFMSEELHEASPASQLWLVEGATHNNLRRIAGARYIERIQSFLQAL
jgi:fermentation-respiration switch protein FrsA (DUF1100 family)